MYSEYKKVLQSLINVCEDLEKNPNNEELKDKLENLYFSQAPFIESLYEEG